MTDTDISQEDTIDRLHVAAFKLSRKLWPLLVRSEAARSEPNLISPTPLVTVNELEDYIFQELVEAKSLGGDNHGG